jgi:hypothetical protein
MALVVLVKLLQECARMYLKLIHGHLLPYPEVLPFMIIFCSCSMICDSSDGLVICIGGVLCLDPITETNYVSGDFL